MAEQLDLATFAEISGEARKALADKSFALPEQRKFPVHDAAHVRNAAARLAQVKKAGKISDSDYAKAKKAIVKAAKKYDVKTSLEADLSPGDVHVPSGEGGKPAKKRPRGLALVMDHPQHGRVEIRQFNNSSLELDGRCVMAEEIGEFAAAAGEQDAFRWIQIAKCGHFVVGDRSFDVTPETLRSVAANFKATQNKRIPIDFEHASVEEPSQGNIPQVGVPAQGWVLDVDARADGTLWGYVELLPLALSYVKGKQYKYISPVIWFNARDRNTGKPIGAWLDSIALTNKPRMDGMMPLAAKNIRGMAMTPPHEAMPRIKAALGLHPLASMAECSDTVGKLRAMCMSAADSGKSIDEPHQGVNLRGYVGALSEVAQGHQYTEDLLDAVQEMIDAAIAQHNLERHDALDDDDDDFASTATTETSETMIMSDKPTDQNPTTPVGASPNTAPDAAKLVADLETKFEAKFSAQSLEMVELKATNKRLSDELAAREAKEKSSSEEAEIDAYIAANKLQPTSRAMALSHRRLVGAEEFAKQYGPVPMIASDRRYLLNDVTTQGANRGAPDPRVTELVASFTAGGMPVEEARAKAAEQVQAQDAPPDKDALVAKYLDKEQKKGTDYNTALAIACSKADRKIKAYFSAERF